MSKYNAKKTEVDGIVFDSRREADARMAGEAQKLFVMTNNHYRGQELVNAIEMKSMLSGNARLPVPEGLLAHYPRLRARALPVQTHGALAF